MMQSRQELLIIGIGNTLRRDDGAGWVLAERLAAALRAAGQLVHLRCVHQLAPELAEEIAESTATALLFVDVAAGGEAPAVQPVVPDPTAFPASTHHLAPAALLLLVEKLYGPWPPTWLATVPGVDFEHGEGLSAVAAAGVEAALEAVWTQPCCARNRPPV